MNAVATPIPTAATPGAAQLVCSDRTTYGETSPFLVDIPETLRLLGNMAHRSYQRLRSSGKFAPKAIKIGGRIYHRPDELKAWCMAGCPPAARWEWQ